MSSGARDQSYDTLVVNQKSEIAIVTLCYKWCSTISIRLRDSSVSGVDGGWSPHFITLLTWILALHHHLALPFLSLLPRKPHRTMYEHDPEWLMTVPGCAIITCVAKPTYFQLCNHSHYLPPKSVLTL